MRTRILSLFTVIGMVAVLVLVGNSVSVAATGNGFFIGKTNKTPKITTLARTKPGAALRVRTKKSTNPPLVVNGKGRVKNLNADLLDGLDSTQLVTRSELAAANAELDRVKAEWARKLPVAIGNVTADGAFVPETTTGVDAVIWNAGLERYELTLTGARYSISRYHTTVTPMCVGGASVGATADLAGFDGKLLVKIHDADAASTIQCRFTFSITML